MSSNTLYFVNPGEIDIRAVTTLGVNVKENPSPIGHFGTGIKYAIAWVLKHGGEVKIYSGLHCFKFTAEPSEIRGLSFSIVHMWQEETSTVMPLGFTTDLGRDWEAWMVYRELRSNALDEGGDEQVFPVPAPAAGTTLIEVSCAELIETRRTRNTFWLEGEPLWSNDRVACFENASYFLFYHGIRAQAQSQSSSKPWRHSWSLLGQEKLTEDRTLASVYDARVQIAQAIIAHDDVGFIDECLEGYAESELDYDWAGHPPSSAFVQAVLDRLHKKQAVPSSARAAVKREDEDEVEKAENEVPDKWDDMLRLAPSEAPEVRESIYSYIREVDARIEGLEAEVKYWKACAEKLGEGKQP